MMRATGSACMTPIPSPASFAVLAAPILATSPLELAQVSSSGGSASAQTIALWAAALIGAIVLGAVGLLFLRRRLLGAEDDRVTEVLSLHELRQMRSRGDLSEEEFEAAKAALLGLAAPSRERKAPAGFDLTGEPLPRRAASPGIEGSERKPEG